MLSAWPTDRPVPTGDTLPVEERLVVLVPGYDPDAVKRARMLFVREFGRYARRFQLRKHKVSPARPMDGDLGLEWTIAAEDAIGRTNTTFQVVRWDDIVRKDFEKSAAGRIGILFFALADLTFRGVLRRYFRHNWKFGGVIVYPFVMIVGLVVVSVFAAWIASFGAALGAEAWVPGLKTPLALAAGSAAAFGVVRAARPFFDRWFVWHLLHDWIFNWQHGSGRRPDFEKRVEVWAEHLAKTLDRSPAQEIVVIGHSTGAVMAVEIVARALERRVAAPPPRAALRLLTVGSCLPIVALLPPAQAAHAAVRRLVGEASLLWVEYQAPQDWMNFPGFDPARDLGHLGIVPKAGQRFNPVIRSARFAETMAEASYRSILWRPFRMHFQFLMANDKPGEYDFFAITCGSMPLNRRCLDRSPSLPVSASEFDVRRHDGDEKVDPLTHRLSSTTTEA